MSTKITDSYFKYGTLKYFRGNAIEIEMCTFGDKDKPLGRPGYLEPHGKVKRKYVDDRSSSGSTVSINWGQTTRADVEANGQLKVFGLNAKFATTFSFNQVKTANVRLHYIYMNEGPLKRMLNQDANVARNFLRDEGQDGRIVSGLWICLDGELGAHFDTSASFAFGIDGTDLKLTAKGGVHGTQTISISPGTTFAYRMHKVKKWNRGKTKIEDMESDYSGNS